MMSQTSDHFLSNNSLSSNIAVTSSASLEDSFIDDVTITSSATDYPPNVAISPGSCKSPYCCTSPGFCNFPFHHTKGRLHGTSNGDVTYNGICRTRSDPFPRDQVFVPDSADLEAKEICTESERRLSIPMLAESLHHPETLPQITVHDDFIGTLPAIASLSSSSVSSTESSIFSDPLLVDITGNDVMGLLKSPKLEITEQNCFNKAKNVPTSNTPASLAFSSSIRRSPPPPNVTLNPEKHKRSTLPQGKLSLYEQRLAKLQY